MYSSSVHACVLCPVTCFVLFPIPKYPACANLCYPPTLPAGASRCAPGFWAAKGSLKPCQQCPAGRTTDDDKLKQKAATDCYVREGFGVVNSTANATDAFTFSTTGLTNDTLANLPVVECPIGMYSSDKGQKVLNRRCMACTTGSSTQEPGRSNSTQCDGECLRLC
jgi:hypothetical protein